MKLNVNEEGNITLREVFVPIVFISESGEELIVCMRDNGFEVRVRDFTAKGDRDYYSTYTASSEGISPLCVANTDINPIGREKEVG